MGGKGETESRRKSDKEGNKDGINDGMKRAGGDGAGRQRPGGGEGKTTSQNRLEK